jgi:hypothetical protein
LKQQKLNENESHPHHELKADSSDEEVGESPPVVVESSEVEVINAVSNPD